MYVQSNRFSFGKKSDKVVSYCFIFKSVKESLLTDLCPPGSGQVTILLSRHLRNNTTLFNTYNRPFNFNCLRNDARLNKVTFAYFLW